jgi:hypothetical protein
MIGKTRHVVEHACSAVEKIASDASMTRVDSLMLGPVDVCSGGRTKRKRE